MAGGDNSELVMPKRRRTAVACVSCRMRKSRCDGGMPACAMCRELGVGCFYMHPRKNAVPRGDIPSATSQDERLSAIESKLDRLLLAASSSSSLSAPSDSAETAPRNPPATLVTRSLLARDRDSDSKHGQTHLTKTDDHEEEDEDGDDEEEEDIMLDGMASIADSGLHEKTFFGPTSSVSFLQTLSTASLALFSNPTDPQEQQQMLITSQHTPKSNPSSSASKRRRQSRPNPLTLPPHLEVLDLLESYFTVLGYLFPFIDKDDVLSTYETGRSKGFRRSFLALINAIMALMTHERKPLTASMMNPASESSCKEAETFYARAETLLSAKNVNAHNLEIVQCLLLMVQYSQATPHSARVWSLFGNAVTTAMQLGLHAKSYPPMRAEQQELRRRSWWQIIALDRVLSMTFGRPFLIPEATIVLPLPSTLDLKTIARNQSNDTYASDQQVANSDVFFLKALQLYSIMARIMETVYDNNMSSSTDAPLSRTLSAIQNIQSRLAEWRNDLPSDLQFKPLVDETAGHDNTSTAPRDGSKKPPSTRARILYLRYLNIRNLMYRAILCSYLEAMSNSEPGGRSDFLTSEYSAFMTFLAYHGLNTVQEVASEVIDIVGESGAKPRAVGAVWFATYYVFHACLSLYGVVLVLVGYRVHLLFNLPPLGSDPNDVENVVAKLRRGLRVLEEVSKGITPETRNQQQAMVARMVSMATKLAQQYAAGQSAQNRLWPIERAWDQHQRSQMDMNTGEARLPDNNDVLPPPPQAPLEGGYSDAQIFDRYLQSTLDFSADFSFLGPSMDF